MLQSMAKRSSASFATFVHTAKETGEIAKYSIILGADTHTLYQKDVKKLERVIRWLKRINAAPHVILAAEETLASRLESLTKGVGNNSAYTNADTYDYIDGLPGVRIHRETGALYVSGLLNSKVVIQDGAPRKKVNSAPKTIAKNRLKYILPSGRFRLFALANVTRAAINGDVLELVTAG
jgi:hypothetical protein